MPFSKFMKPPIDAVCGETERVYVACRLNLPGAVCV